MISTSEKISQKSALTQPFLTNEMEVSNLLDPAMPTFILVDPMLGEPMPGIVYNGDFNDLKRNRETAWGRDTAQVQLSARTSLQIHQHPYLVALHGKDDPLIAESVAIAHAERTASLTKGLEGHGGAAHRIGGWIQSSAHFDELCLILARVMQVKTDASTNASFLRLVDRRVLALVRHIVGDERVAVALGRVNLWCYMDLNGGLSQLRNVNAETTELRLSQTEWSLLLDGEIAHRAIAQWQGEFAGGRGSIPPPSVDLIYKRFLGAAADAKKAIKKWPHRFRNLADITAWTVLSILYQDFPYIDEVRHLMDQPGSADEPCEPVSLLHAKLRALVTCIDEKFSHAIVS